MAVWPGDQNVVFSETKRIANGDLYNMTVLTINVHTGTHIDAPRHFIDGGLTMERLFAAGRYQIAALPLPLKGGNGSPARVVLMEDRSDPLPLG